MKHPASWSALMALGGVLALAAPACGGWQAGYGPSAVGIEEKGLPTPLEIVHEPCDVESKDAVRLDSSGGSKPDTTRVFAQGSEICRAVDVDRDGKPDVYVYFEPNGAIRRQETSTGRDGRLNEIAHYQNGLLFRKDKETNGDGKLDTWEYYEAGQVVHTLRDADGNGQIDEWSWLHPKKPNCNIVHTDRDGDGKSDQKEERCAPAPAVPPVVAPAASGPRAP